MSTNVFNKQRQLDRIRDTNVNTPVNKTCIAYGFTGLTPFIINEHSIIDISTPSYSQKNHSLPKD